MTKALIFLGALTFATSTLAQPPLVVTALPFKAVSYADLNIGSKAGQDRLASRIRSAASDLCLENNIEQVKFSQMRHTCYNSAVSDGYRQMQQAVAARASGATLATATLIIRGK